MRYGKKDLAISKIIRIFTYIQQLNNINFRAMSWYSTFKKGTKDAIAKGKSKVSSFWYDDYDTSFDYLEEYGDMKSKDFESYKKTHNLYKLASVRRAISNFVQIVTQKNVPVTFATKSDSKTDGKQVILSADVDDKFDVSVGLALHEGSHIILSDFKLLQILRDVKIRHNLLLTRVRNWNEDAKTNNQPIPYPNKASYDKLMTDIIYNGEKHEYHSLLEEIYLSTGKIGKYGDINDTAFDILGALTNWIEDRRIDNYIYKSAPGYRDYYVQMYDNYFNDKIVSKGIASDEYTDEDWDSYLFRIINILNENTDLSKLKGLRSVYRLLDLKNISRLKSTKDALTLAIDVMAELFKYIPVTESGVEAKPNKFGNGTDSDFPADINEQADTNDEMGGASGDVTSEGTPSSNAPSDDTSGKDLLSPTAKKQLLSKFEKQKDFINGNIKKKSISKVEKDKLTNIQDSGTELVRVGMDLEGGRNVGKGVDCIVVRKLTPALVASSDFPFTHTNWNNDECRVYYDEEVKRGTMLGVLLGKKLQIRSESRETVFSRLKKGKIDARMVASLGYDNENVFFTNEIDQFKKGNLHISIDYSGSMQGEKLRKCIVSTVAIVKACQMARNINVQVSIRSTEASGRALPYVAIVYDSRRDTFRQFCYFMSIMTCTNTTPEGLCFEAIMKEIIPSTNETDSYFLNFSDGEPCYNISGGTDDINYSGHSAALHTAKQVKKMKLNGINVLSYFISDYGRNIETNSSWLTFKECYGNDAKCVNVENMFEVAKTMNELFLSKK